MNSKLFAMPAIASMLIFGALAISLSSRSAFAQSSDDTWYVGEGAKPDMYVKYKIADFDVNNGEPYEMTIYFKEQDAKGVWTAPTFVVYKGQVYTGTLRLGDNMASLGAGANISDDLRPFVNGYGLSLQWLEAFTAKSRPLSLSASSWGKIASIGGEQIRPMGTADITVPAGTFHATVLGWHKGVDDKIWVVDNFPYPVKADTFVEVSSGRPPTQFSFELLQTGTGEPKPPTNIQEIPQPPIQLASQRGTYQVNLDWEPKTIQPNSTVQFAASFFDNNSQPLQRVSYDFTVTDSKGTILYDKKNSFTGDSGIGFETVNFKDGGAVRITVTINSHSGVDTGLFTETVNFDLVVVPEFPASAAIIAGAVIGLVVLLTRFRGVGIGSILGGKGPL